MSKWLIKSYLFHNYQTINSISYIFTDKEGSWISTYVRNQYSNTLDANYSLKQFIEHITCNTTKCRDHWVFRICSSSHIIMTSFSLIIITSYSQNLNSTSNSNAKLKLSTRNDELQILKITRKLLTKRGKTSYCSSPKRV